MCEVHKPEQWPEVVRRAMEAGGKICGFRDVPVKGDCLVRIGTNWYGGIKLPKPIGGNINFVITDEKAPEDHRLGRFWAVPLDTTVIAISEPESVKETVDTTISELVVGDEFLCQGFHVMKTAYSNDGVVLEGKHKGVKWSCDFASQEVQKIIRNDN